MPGPEIGIRRASVDDAPAIAALLRAAFASFEARYTAAAFAATCPPAAVLAARLTEGPTWIATHFSGVVGTVSAIERPDGVYVRSMAVATDARGRGIGRALLAQAEAFARERRARRVYLSTTPFLHGAIALYRQAGFAESDGLSDLFGTPLFAMEKLLSEDDAALSRAPRDDGPRNEA